jgi:hypothetical protein
VPNSFRAHSALDLLDPSSLRRAASRGIEKIFTRFSRALRATVDLTGRPEKSSRPTPPRGPVWHGTDPPSAAHGPIFHRPAPDHGKEYKPGRARRPRLPRDAHSTLILRQVDHILPGAMAGLMIANAPRARVQNPAWGARARPAAYATGRRGLLGKKKKKMRVLDGSVHGRRHRLDRGRLGTCLAGFCCWSWTAGPSG